MVEVTIQPCNRHDFEVNLTKRVFSEKVAGSTDPLTELL
jgi:hypothetical protein